MFIRLEKRRVEEPRRVLQSAPGCQLTNNCDLFILKVKNKIISLSQFLVYTVYKLIIQSQVIFLTYVIISLFNCNVKVQFYLRFFSYTKMFVADMGNWYGANWVKCPN